MAVKNLSTRVAIIGRGAKCRGGSSAVDKSAYISRTTMYSEYDGTTYYPKYTEDLVHNEVMLPVNAPAEYSDPSVLWNSVEMRESKSAKAQLARSYKINLPNEWSYELAIEVMRDYVKRNFVDDGMCAQFAIHDSENPNTHQRNLHCHIMLTMRPILEDGSWGDKQKKIYALDADGNKIRKKNGQYKCTTQDVTGWNSRENARKWRKDLADTINAVNDKNGLRENFWEHRSFAEQGLDTIPQIHLGEKASALERAGIQTERGNVNRRIMEQNKAILTAKMLVAKAEEQLQKLVNSKPVEAVRNTANEVLDMIRAVVGKKGRLELPVIKSKYLRKISQRQSLQEQERMERFVVANQIESFEQLQEFKTQREPAYEKLSAERQQLAEQIARLEQLLVAYSDYEPYIVYHKTSNSLKGFAKRKYDKEHETELREYDSYRAKLKKMLSSDEKITPKKWTAEKAKLEETGTIINYMELVRDALDYRKWFEFQMFFRRGEETKKPLTNAAFNRFSGGEKAMAMYVPLFGAVNAQYKKADNKDHPRIIALDEAFAGVDDKNIKSMFELVHKLDFDYIMNSQALWGCFETVKGLRIAELHRPENSQVVSVIRYTWNGHERILDEQ